MEAGLDRKLDKITIAGGVSQNEFWIQNKVDMLGIPMEVSEVDEATPLGCAMLAGIGVGLYKDIDEAYERVKKPGKTYKPDTDLTEQYAELFKIHKEVYPALKNLNHTIFDKYQGTKLTPDYLPSAASSKAISISSIRRCSLHPSGPLTIDAISSRTSFVALPRRVMTLRRLTRSERW